MLRVFVEHAGPLDLAGDEACHGGGAVHGGQDGEVVAGADLAVRAAEPLEGRLCLRRKNVLRAGIFGEMIVAGEIVHHDVVLVQPLARRDRGGRKADDLAELEDGLALADRDHRHLVAAGHPRQRRDALNDGAGSDRIDRDDEVVRLVEADDTRVECGLVQHRRYPPGQSVRNFPARGLGFVQALSAAGEISGSVSKSSGYWAMSCGSERRISLRC